MRYSKWFLWTAIILSAVGLIIYTFPLQSKIDTILQGIQCRIGDTDYSEEVSISVKGVYKQYLFKNDIFQGTIKISGYDIISDDYTVSLVFSGGYTNLIYLGVLADDYKAIPFQEPIGMIFADPAFAKLTICVSEHIDSNSKRWSGENGLFISAPANNLSQAVEIAKELFGRNDDFSRIFQKETN